MAAGRPLAAMHLRFDCKDIIIYDESDAWEKRGGIRTIHGIDGSIRQDLFRRDRKSRYTEPAGGGMNRLTDPLLKKYAMEDWLLQRKAKTLLILSLTLSVLILLEILVSSIIVGHLAPEFFSNLAIVLGLAVGLIPLIRGRYHLSAGWSIILALFGLTWTRYVGTGYFSPNASYDFIQYTLSLSTVIFYTNLIAHKRSILVASIAVCVVLLGAYAYGLRTIFQTTITSAAQSVILGGFVFLIVADLFAFFSFQQNQKAIDIAFQESESSKRSERNYREIFNSTNEAIFIHDSATGRVLDVNDAMVKMYGCRSKEQALALGIEELSANTPPYTGQDALRHLSDTGKLGSQTFEWLARKATGQEFWVEVSLRKSEIGGQGRVLAVVRDVSERKRAEAAALESRERLSLFMESASDSIYILDSRLNFLEINERAVQIIGMKREEIIGRNIADIVPDVKTSGRYEKHLSVMRTGEPFVIENFVPHPRFGNMYFILKSFKVGNGLGVIAHDITELKRMQAQLIESQKLEAIGRLAGGVAHDFNNMIAVVLGYTTLLENEIPAAGPARDQLKSIRDAAERSADLTRQLLAFSRRQMIVPVELDLNTELKSLHKMLERLIGEDISLLLKYGRDLWNVKMDATQLAQIVTNLETNARDAIDGTGTITIETANARLERTEDAAHADIPPGEYVLLSFSDSGCGMDEEIMAHIFEPFFTTKPVGKGTGLGLSTVFGIVKQNDGFIDVVSRVGGGTTFHLYFPRHKDGSAKRMESTDTVDLRGFETVLLVEDEKALLKLTKKTLSGRGYNVLAAGVPSEAIALSESFMEKIDILITDVVMPEMNGKQLKERLQKNRPSLLTLFTSGYTSDVVADRGVLEEGMNFLQKPYTTDNLLRKVREVLNERPTA